MKKLFFILQGGSFIAFNFFLLLTIYQLAGSDSTTIRPRYSMPVYDGKEEYDPSLLRLNSMKDMQQYCDSLYAEQSYRKDAGSFEETYPAIVSSAVSRRFYHGYSMYGFNNNYVATLASSAVRAGELSAIVLPEDLMKFPYAACSQQSILVVDLLQRKGFKTRKIGFQGKKYGHFCFEVFYNGSWHFFDPDMEPDPAVLSRYNRPGIAFLARNPDILMAAYARYSKDMVLDIFPNYHLGKANASLAPNAAIFHRVTGFLSYSMWFFSLLVFIWMRKLYKRAGASAPKVPGKIAVMRNPSYKTRYALR